MAWPIIGKAFSPAEFEAYVRGLTWTDAFRPDGIVIHNTASPCLANRPVGLTRQHIQNLEGYYKNTCKWSGGPHLFIDDKVIWVFNDLTKRGTHSPSWNGSKLGIEMLGDFDKESFAEGRGRKVRDLTVAAAAILNNVLGFPADGFKFHCEDKKTDHACPGKQARAARAALIEEIASSMLAYLENPVLVVGDDTEADAVPLAVDATAGADEKTGVLASVSMLNSLADQGSRIAGSIRDLKRFVWWGGTGTTATVAAVKQTKTGTTLGEIMAANPFATFMVGMLIALAVAWIYAKRQELGLVRAHKDNRYQPKGGA